MLGAIKEKENKSQQQINYLLPIGISEECLSCVRKTKTTLMIITS